MSSGGGKIKFGRAHVLVHFNFDSVQDLSPKDGATLQDGSALLETSPAEDMPRGVPPKGA